MTVINGVSLDKTGEKQGRWKPGQSGNPNRDNLYEEGRGHAATCAAGKNFVL